MQCESVSFALIIVYLPNTGKMCSADIKQVCVTKNQE